MSKYILDTSIVIQRFIQDIHSGEVKILFNQLTQSDEFIVPEFCLLECSNVFWKHVRFHGMPQLIAESHIDDLNRLPITIYLVTDFIKDALQIGLNHQLATYDSIYIVLAKRLNYPLITDDEKQAKVARLEGILLKSIMDFNGGV